eukprot:9471288-Pyramimonas_sp.AAC.1
MVDSGDEAAEALTVRDLLPLRLSDLEARTRSIGLGNDHDGCLPIQRARHEAVPHAWRQRSLRDRQPHVTCTNPSH